MINRVVLVGRLTKDLTLAKTQTNKSVVQFTIACNRNVKNESGDNEADFINCVAWNKVADLMCQYLRKGSMVGLEGRIQTRNFDDRNGKRVYVTEVLVDNVQFLDTKSEQQSHESSQGYNYQSNGYYTPSANQNGYQNADYGYQSDTVDIKSDDLPF